MDMKLHPLSLNFQIEAKLSKSFTEKMDNSFQESKNMSTHIYNVHIHFGFNPYTTMCVSNVYTVLSRALWKKKTGIWLG